jgi:hypothetical protein
MERVVRLVPNNAGPVVLIYDRTHPKVIIEYLKRPAIEERHGQDPCDRPRARFLGSVKLAVDTPTSTQGLAKTVSQRRDARHYER